MPRAGLGAQLLIEPQFAALNALSIGIVDRQAKSRDQTTATAVVARPVEQTGNSVPRRLCACSWQREGRFVLAACVNCAVSRGLVFATPIDNTTTAVLFYAAIGAAVIYGILGLDRRSWVKGAQQSGLLRHHGIRGAYVAPRLWQV